MLATTFGQNLNPTCAEKDPICDTEKRAVASDITAPPPRLPPLELDPVGESGSWIPQWRPVEEEEEEEVEAAGLGRRKAGCEGLRVGVTSRVKEGLRGEEWRKEAGDWASSAVEEEEEVQSKSLMRKINVKELR